jgi:hypothetical protein
MNIQRKKVYFIRIYPSFYNFKMKKTKIYKRYK